jgi:multicomponent Na+:H+ antiporter subunit G
VGEALHLFGGGVAIAGAILVVIGAVGMLRFPDVYTRIHAASVTDTGGATLVLLGLCIVSGLSLETLKLAIIWVFILLTSPAASHALADAAFSSGHTPWAGAFRIVRASDPEPGRRKR